MPSVMFLVSYVFLKSESLTGPAIWGLIFGTLAYWSKGLAIPIGFHTGVNFVQALFSQKEKWASGIWTFDIADEITPFTVDQITVGMKIFLLVAGLVFVEMYLRKTRRPGAPFVKFG